MWRWPEEDGDDMATSWQVMHRSIVGSGKENQRAPILRSQLYRKIVEDILSACDVEIKGFSYDRGEFQNVLRYYDLVVIS